MPIMLLSTVTCPACATPTTHTMPKDACVIVRACRHCGVQMRPKAGDCCVFCSYGDVPCPPMQQERGKKKPEAVPEP